MRRTEGESLWPPAREQSASRDTGRAVSARRPATISYGTPVHGVDYPSTARVDPRSVTANTRTTGFARRRMEGDDEVELQRQGSEAGAVSVTRAQLLLVLAAL